MRAKIVKNERKQTGCHFLNKDLRKWRGKIWNHETTNLENMKMKILHSIKAIKEGRGWQWIKIASGSKL